MSRNNSALGGSHSRAASNASQSESGDPSALDVYRQWLDAASSGSDSDDDDSTSNHSRQPRARSSVTPKRRSGMDLPRPVSPEDPINRPQMTSPRNQLHLLPTQEQPSSLSQSSPSLQPQSSVSSAKPSLPPLQQPQPQRPQPPSRSSSRTERLRSPPKLLSTPRKLMHQMSFRSMLSPSPQAQPAGNHDGLRMQRQPPPPETPRARNNSRQSSLGTLFSDAWIAQPVAARRPSRVVAKSGRPGSRQPMYDVPLDNSNHGNEPLPRQRTFSDSSDTVAEKPALCEKPPRRRTSSSAEWEFHRIDSARGWWVVGWAFMACFVSLSTLVTYPIYESYYISTAQATGQLEDINKGEDQLERRNYLSTYVVLVGTLMSGFAGLGSLGAGIASDVFGLRVCALAGTMVLCIGLLASSFIDKLWALCITQGVVSGIGIALLALPAYTAPAHWFERHRALSTGTAVAGTGLGVLALTPAYRAILRHRGLAVCLYVQTIVTLVLGITSSMGLRARVDQRGRPSKMHWRKVFKDLRILALMLMAFFAAAARFAQLLCLPAFAYAAGIENDAAGVLYAMGAALLVGMLLGGAAADKSGYIAGIGLSELILGLFTLVLYTPSVSVAPLYVFAVVFGLTTGTLAAVLPAAIAQMFGTQRIATTTGIILAACAPALLATTPAAVKFIHLLDSGKSIAWLSAISGVFSVLAGFIGMLLPVLQRRYIKVFTKRESDIVW